MYYRTVKQIETMVARSNTKRIDSIWNENNNVVIQVVPKSRGVDGIDLNWEEGVNKLRPASFKIKIQNY